VFGNDLLRCDFLGESSGGCERRECDKNKKLPHEVCSHLINPFKEMSVASEEATLQV
jgi:hypothetical protein